MLHLLTLRFTQTAEEAMPFIAAHFEYLDRNHKAGTFLASGATIPASEGGAIIAAGVDRDTIEKITAGDPLAVNGVVTYTITTMTPERLHPALTELLGS